MKYVKKMDGMAVMAESGATFDKSAELATRAMTTHKLVWNPDRVILHLGTCDITQNKKNGPHVMLNCSQAINQLQCKFPDAAIWICSIPPRKGQSSKVDNDLNATTAGVNSYIESMCRRSERLEYVDTHTPLMGGKSIPLGRMYSKTDTSGVHLNDEGKQLIMNTIMTSMQQFVAEAETPAAESNKRKPSQTTPGSTHRVAKDARLDSSSETVHDQRT